MRFIALSTLAAACWLGACGNCEDEAEVAERFLNVPEHQSCEVDEDCVGASVGCALVAGSLCGVVEMNRTAFESGEWKKIEAGLKGCETGCSVCAALLIVGCNRGACAELPLVR